MTRILVTLFPDQYNSLRAQPKWIFGACVSQSPKDHFSELGSRGQIPMELANDLYASPVSLTSIVEIHHNIVIEGLTAQKGWGKWIW